MSDSRALPEVTEADVDRLASHVGLTIPPESRAAVAQHLAGLLASARLIDEFSLLDAEPAPRFDP
jgi:hypothetical protein